MFRTMIVEDERPILDLMKVLVGQNSNYSIVGAFTNPVEALANLQELQPDIVFIDVEMPRMNGLQLAVHIHEQLGQAEIVFTTAYKDYALEAFEVSALDYILKPVTPQAIQRVTGRLFKHRTTHIPAETLKSSFSVRCFGEFEVLNPEGLPVHFRTRRTEELFAYLLCHPGRYISKWKLIDLLWQDAKGERGLSNLHNTLYLLKKVLKENKIPMSIQKLNDGYRLDTANKQYDLLLYHQLQQVHSEGRLTTEQVEELCSLYQGQLLEGKNYLWKIPLEEAFFKQYTAMVRELAAAELTAGNGAAAELRLEQYLSLYPLEEEMNRLLISMYRGRGALENINRRYEQFAAACKNELGLELPPEIKEEWLQAH